MLARGPLHVCTTCLKTSRFLYGSPGSGDPLAAVLCLLFVSTTKELKNSRCALPKFHPGKEMHSCETQEPQQCGMAGQSRSLPAGFSVSFTVVAIMETYSGLATASYSHLSSLSLCRVLVILYRSEGTFSCLLHTPYHTQGVWDPFLALRKVRKTAWFSKAKPDHHLWIPFIRKMRMLHRKSS